MNNVVVHLCGRSLTFESMKYQLAQVNVGRIQGVNMDDPVMKEFVDNLDRINALAEESDGFIWRLQDEDGDATSFNPYNDAKVIINVSVWRDVDALKNYVYRTVHSSFLKRKKEWFQKFGDRHMALWWISAGEYPTIQEAVDRVALIQQNGPTAEAFDFKTVFDRLEE